MTDLSKFEGHDVVATAIRVTNAGDGLSESLRVEPLELNLGDTVHLVIEATVSRIQYDPSRDDPENLIRVQTLKAGTATLVDGALVEDVLEAQKEKNRRAEEEAKGIQRLPVDEDDDSDLTDDERDLKSRLDAASEDL